MYRALMLALGVVVVAGFAGQSLAADGNLSNSMLSDMGLSGMQVMSDTQGQEVRGSFAAAWGSSYAYVRGAGADDGYSAVGRRVAVGFTLSAAANRCSWAVAGGISGAYAR